MNRGVGRGLLAALLGAWLAGGCLGIGGVDEGSPAGGGSGGAGGAGGAVGDGSWPDGPGGSGGSDASTGGTTNVGGDGGTAAGGAGTGAAGGSGGSGGSGAGGATGGAGGTGGSGGGTASAHVYTYNLSTAAWSAPVALSAIWTGANAPPSTGILAVTQLEHFDRLLVFADDGKYYLRVDGAWQTPVATTTAFPTLAGLSIGALYHVASPPGTTPLSETITFTANPTAVLYKYNANDSVVWLDTVTMTDEPSPGAPQGTGKALFNFEIRDVSKFGSADYYLFYGGYSNGYLYQLDAAIAWKSWPIAQSPFWSGKPNAPPTSGLEAAWTDAALGRVFIVGP